MSRNRRLARFAHLPVLEPHTSILPEAQLAIWPLLSDIPEHFVLYGGTGLGVRLGHRTSVDFHFFSAQSFKPTDLLGRLAWLGPVAINDAGPNTLIITTATDVNLSFFGAAGIQSVAEPSIVESNGLVVASTFDLGGTKAKTILDRSEWSDYVAIASVLRAGVSLPELIGYATTVFAPKFAFPAAVFLRSLAWFGDGTAADVPDDMKHELQQAVAGVRHDDIPDVTPFAPSILP